MVGLLALGVCSLQAVNQKVTYVFSTILAGYQGDASLADSSEEPVSPADKSMGGPKKPAAQADGTQAEDSGAPAAEDADAGSDEDQDNEED